MEVPFEHVAMDLVGSPKKYHWIPVHTHDHRLCYQVPEVVLLQSITAWTIAGELLKVFTQVGLPREILTDQGTNFTLWLLRQVYGLLGVKQLHTFAPD